VKFSFLSVCTAVLNSEVEKLSLSYENHALFEIPKIKLGLHIK
jgi:hypothetical protein